VGEDPSAGFTYGRDLGYECQFVQPLRTLADLVDRDRLDAIGVSPDAPALTDSTTSLSWGEYSDRVARTAAALGAAGVQPGDRVGIHLTKSVHSFVAVHAVLRAGAVVIPVDPLAPAELAGSVLRDAGAEVVVTDARPALLAAVTEQVDLRAMLLPRAVAPPETAAKFGGGPIVITGADIEATLAGPTVRVDPGDPAYIIYTSGSTGRPKGIVHTHRSGLAYAVAAAAGYELRPDDRMVNIAPLHFDQSTFELYASAIVGAAVIVVPDPVMRFPASVAAMVEAERATIWYSVPHLLIQMVARGALAERDLSSLRWILFGGEVFPPGQLAALMSLIPSARVSNVYGPAEVNQCTRHDLDTPPTGDEPIPIGGAWDAATVRVVAPDGPVDLARPVSPGEAGVLLVATDTMMTGYWGREDLTAASIVVDDGVRWYVTGDLVVENPSGDLVFLGRVDNQVKIRGHRVELEAIDAVLADIDGVSAATVVVDRSVDDHRLVALIVIDTDQDHDIVIDRALAATRRLLPRYAVPAVFQPVQVLPRTSTGKVDRTASAELLSP
jgi:amino acid adenylation domain-containing protein